MKKKADDRMQDLLLKQEKAETKRHKALEFYKNRNQDIEEVSYKAFGQGIKQQEKRLRDNLEGEKSFEAKKHKNF